MNKHLKYLFKSIGVIVILFSIFLYTKKIAYAHDGGVISSDSEIKYLNDTSVYIIPAEGYELTSLKIDGASVTPTQEYDFNNITTDHTITAHFSLKQDYKMQIEQKSYNWIDLKLNNGTNKDVVCKITVNRASICAHNGHTWQETSRVNATCTQNGYIKSKCSVCGATKTETLNATGHTYTSKITKSPTCTSTGTRTYTCTKCNDTYTETIAKSAHSFTSSQNGSLRTSATCTAPATYYDKCSVCGANATTYHNYGSSLGGHTYTSVQIDSATVKCSRCNAEKNVVAIGPETYGIEPSTDSAGNDNTNSFSSKCNFTAMKYISSGKYHQTTLTGRATTGVYEGYYLKYTGLTVGKRYYYIINQKFTGQLFATGTYNYGLYNIGTSTLNMRGKANDSCLINFTRDNAEHTYSGSFVATNSTMYFNYCFSGVYDETNFSIDIKTKLFE